MKQFKWWFLDNWQSLALFIGLLMLTSFTMLFQLGALTNGLSMPEVSYLANSASLDQILREPSFLPHKLLTFIAQGINESTAALRLPSVLIVIVSVVTAASYLRRRYSLRTVVLGSLVIVTSSWLLSWGRLALPDISLILWAPLFCLWEWLKLTHKAKTATIILVVAASLAIYIPGFVWLVIGLLVLERKTVLQIFIRSPVWIRAITALVTVVILTPLIRSIILAPEQLMLLVGLPANLSALAMLPANLSQTLAELFVVSSKGAVFTVGRLPLLDIFSTVLLFCGIYAQRYSPRRWQIVLFIGSLMSVVFASLGGLVSIHILLPLIYALITAGIGFLLTQWFTVFPYNPIARSIGTTLMTLGILTISFYHINRYFIAWPQVPETRQEFSHSLQKQ